MHRQIGVSRYWIAIAMMAGAGCSAEVSEAEVASSAQALRGVEVTVFDDPAGIGKAGAEEQSVLIRRTEDYVALFGHAPPTDVDFTAGEVVLFYSAGVKASGGYEASIVDVRLRRRRLSVTTRLVSPGPGCPVTLALTQPYVLAKVSLPRRRSRHRVRFNSDDVVRQCPEPDACDDQACPKGQHCELQDVVCVQAPCNPVPVCVDDAPPGPFCGGIAGIACPGAGECVDNPSDGCDPTQGGADCGGVCQCLALGLCTAGSVWDSSPEVCACVAEPPVDPCAVVRCAAGTQCEAIDGVAQCVPVGPFCGGIAGIACPGAGDCIDDPRDSCDPAGGGADCSGLCVCNAAQRCPPGTNWDGASDVCACVSDNPCATVLCAPGRQCQVFDGNPVCVSDGTLACGSAICGKGNVCCNASCGICTPVGFACIQLACAPEE